MPSLTSSLFDIATSVFVTTCAAAVIGTRQLWQNINAPCDAPRKPACAAPRGSRALWRPDVMQKAVAVPVCAISGAGVAPVSPVAEVQVPEVSATDALLNTPSEACTVSSCCVSLSSDSSHSGSDASSCTDTAALEGRDDSCEGSSQDVGSFVASHGLAVCAPKKLLGAGGAGYAELVTVPLPDGSELAAVRKTLKGGKEAALMREVAAMQALRDCPHALKLLGYRAGDTCELLMEYAEGGDLKGELDAVRASRKASIRALTSAVAAASGAEREQLAKQLHVAKRKLLLPLGRIRQIAASVLGALAALHGRGMMHMDVKPENVLLSGGEVKLADMGAACSRDAEGFYPHYAGTVKWMAHEMEAAMLGRPCEFEVTQAADVAAVGILLAACSVFHGDLEGLWTFSHYQRELPTMVPAQLRSFISALAARDPAKRLSAAEALSHPFLSGAGV